MGDAQCAHYCYPALPCLFVCMCVCCSRHPQDPYSRCCVQRLQQRAGSHQDPGEELHRRCTCAVGCVMLLLLLPAPQPHTTHSCSRSCKQLLSTCAVWLWICSWCSQYHLGCSCLTHFRIVYTLSNASPYLLHTDRRHSIPRVVPVPLRCAPRQEGH